MRADMLERLRRSRDWLQAIDDLERDAEKITSKEERSEILFELGSLTEEVVPERDRALAIYQRAWKLFPENVKALTRARELYRELGRLEMVAKVGEIELKLRQGDEQAADLAALVGEALLDSGQKDKALPILELALESSPDTTRVKDAIAAANYDPDLWTDVVERLAKDASKADDSTASRMLLRAARIVSQEMPDNRKRFEELLQQSLSRAPEDEAANFLYERLLAEQGRWDDLEDHHELRAQSVSGHKERAELYRKFALEWVQRFKDRTRAARMFKKAVESAGMNGLVSFPSLVAAFSLIAEACAESGKWSEFLNLVDSLGARLRGDQRVLVSVQAGVIAWKMLNDLERAKQYFSVVRRYEPENQQLADFEKVAGPVEPAVGSDEIRAAASGPMPAQDEMEMADGTIEENAEGTQNDEKEFKTARGSKQQAVVVEDSDEDMPTQLTTEALSPPPAEKAPPAAVVEAAPPPMMVEGPETEEELPSDVEASLRSAQGAEKSGPDKAIEAYRKIVQANPKLLTPRRELVRVLVGAERWNAAVDALKEAEKTASSTGDKARFLRQLVEVYRRVNNDAMVAGTLSQLADIKANDLGVLDELGAQYESMKRWPDLVKTLQRKASMVDHAGKVAVNLRIAELYIERFSNQAEAIKSFEAVLALDPDNEKAIAHLRDVYQKRRDWEKLIQLRERDIDREKNPATRAQMVLEVADLAATKLKKPEVCVYWWERVLNEDGGNEQAITELEKLYERNKDWAKLADMCSRRADIAPDSKKRVEALQKLGLLYTEKVQDNDRAIDAWQRLLAIEPDHRRAQDAIKKLFVTKGAWDELEEFYRGADKVEEYIRVLERQVDAPEVEAKERLRLALKIATLYQTELDKAEKAMRAYEKALSIDENCLTAAEALIPLYEGGRDAKKLIRVLEIQLDQTEDPDRRLERIEKLAEHSEEKLKDRQAAFDWWRKAHAENWQAEHIRTQLERLAGQTGKWSELVSAYQESARKFADSAEALPLYAVIARVLEKELGDIEQAIAVNQKILELSENDEEAVNALERLFIGQQRFAELQAIYERKLELTLDADKRREIQFRVGNLYEEELHDEDKAVATYQSILDDNPDDIGALAALDRLYVKNKKWKPLVDLLTRQIDLASSHESEQFADLKYRLGKLREEHLGDPAGAISAYQEILETQSSYAPAIAALERYLDEDKHKLAVSDILEPIYRQSEQWAKLVPIYEIQVDADERAADRGQLLLTLGELHALRLGDADRAFAAYARAFDENPDSEVAKAQLEELSDLVDRGQERLVDLYVAAIDKTDLDPELRHELSVKVATAYQGPLGNTAQAVKYFERALELQPEDRRTLNALETIFTSEERFENLLKILRRKAELSLEPAERMAILQRVAAIHEDMLGKPEDAISTYNEILEHDGDSREALRALDRLHQGAGRWNDLAENLARQLVLTTRDAERVDLLVRLADLRETKLNEIAAAIDIYRQVLEIMADTRAVGALERLIQLPEHELAVAQILEPVYQTTDDWQSSVVVYEIMARHALDPERKIELLHWIAELYERHGRDGEAAFGSYGRALREDPRSEATQAQLHRLAQQLRKWGDLVELYDDIVKTTSEDDLKAQLLFKVAQTYELEIRDDDKAVETYNRILACSPGNIEAASAIQSIHERSGAYPELVAAILSKAQLILDVPERKELLRKAAHIQEEILEQPEAAVGTYRAILEIDDVEPDALDALERLYIRLEKWAELQEVYAKKAELATDPDEKKRMLFVLGQVYDRELGDNAKAIETYQAVLDIDNSETTAIEALDRLLGQAGRWYDQLQNLEHQVEIAPNKGAIVGLKFRIGELWQDKLSDMARAIESFNEALDIDPSHEATLVALEGIMNRPEGEPMMAARVLEPIYEQSGQTDRLVRVLEVMVRHLEDPHMRVETLHRIAELHEHGLHQPGQAFEAYARALGEDNGNETTLAQLERLAVSSGRWQELADLYAREADKSMEVPRQVDLLTRLARINELELEKTEVAITMYRRVLDVDFDNANAVMALDRLYTATERWTELGTILRKEAQLAGNDEEIVRLQYRLAQVLEHALQDLPAAIDVYREILGTSPGHETTVAALEDMFTSGHHENEIAQILEPHYESTSEYDKLHRIYEVRLTKLSDPTERQGLLQRLAEIAEEQLGDMPGAFRWWGQALAEDPTSEMSREQAERLATAGNLWHELAVVYERVLEAHSGADVRRTTLLHLARVQESALIDQEAAIASYLQALEIDPRDADALEALDRLYTELNRPEELVDVLRRRIEVTLDGDEITNMQLRRGQVLAESLGDTEGALECYQKVLENDTRNRTALEAEERIYFQREDWRSLFSVYEKLVDVATGDDELSEIYARMARIASDGLQNDDHAVDFWSRVLDIRGDDPLALSELGQLYARRGAWEELIDVLERQANQSGPDERIGLLKQVGRVWSEKLGRERNALDAWLRAIELDPNDQETLKALAALYRNAQSWEELSQTLRRIIDVGQNDPNFDEGELCQLYAQLGELEGEILCRTDEAVDAWQRVTVLNPRDFRALAALEQLFTRESRWEECISVLERRVLVLSDDGQKLETLLQAAAIWEEKVENLEQAAQVYDRVRHMQPGHPIASTRLEEIYRQQYKWESLTEVLLERVEYSSDQRDRITLFQTVAKVFEQELGDQERAFVVLQAAFREDYSDEDTAHELERLATAAGKWQELLADYTEVVQGLESESPDKAADLWVKIGRWYADHAQHLEYAIHSAQQALRLDGQHIGALRALADFQRKRGSWHELVSILSRHAAIEQEPDKVVELYLTLADLLENQLQDPDQAIRAYRSALQADAGCVDALVSLERLHRGRFEWSELVDVLSRRAEVSTDPEEIIGIRLQIGQLWDEQLQDPARAIRSFQDVLETDPSNMDALRALESLYERTGQTEQYLDVLEAQLDHSPSVDEKVILYARMANAWEERFRKLDRAAECLEKIVALDPYHTDSYNELERLYRQEAKYEGLVDAYRRHIMVVQDGRERIDLYCAMGEVYENNLKDFDRAIEAYNEVLGLDEAEPRALDALGRLYEQVEEWHRAIEVMSHLVHTTSDPNVQVDLYHRIGRITHLHLHDVQIAEQHFMQALSIDEGHVPTMRSLIDLYGDRDDWMKAAQVMIRAEAYSQNPLEKVRFLYEAARTYQDRLGQPDEAERYYGRVLQIDPEHVEAAQPLSDLYFQNEKWEQLSPVLDMLVRKLAQRSENAEMVRDLYYRTARTATALKNYDKAAQFYSAAYEIDPTWLPVLTGRADLLFDMRDWDGASKIYQTILVQHRESLRESDVVRTYYRLGMVRQNLGERHKAVNMFEKALEIDPHDFDTLNAIISIQVNTGDWEAVIHAKRGLLARASDADAVKVLLEIGDIYVEKLKNAQKAIAAYNEALERDPEHRQILQKLLDLYTETEKWTHAVEIIQRFIALENDPMRKGAYYQAAGTICRDKIKAIDEAVEFFNKALDAYFAQGSDGMSKDFLGRALKPFQDIDRILTQKRDWKNQERAYRAMIKRLRAGDPILVQLWHALGEIYRSRLKQMEAAIAAFEVAQKLDPNNAERREILAELHVMAGPDHADKAIEQHQGILRDDPFRYDSYKALRRMYMETRQYDKTWCVCNTLAFLKKADAEEMQFYEQYKPRGFVKAKQRMTEEQWRTINHVNENPYVSAIFAAIWRGVAMMRAQPLKAFPGNLKRKDKQALENDQLQFSKIFFYVSQVLQVPLPDVYLRPDEQGEVAFANAEEKGMLTPTFLVRANLLQGRSEKEIAFASARWLTLMRPDHFLKLAVPTNTELKVAFLSAIALVKPDFPIPGDSRPMVQQYLPQIQKVMQQQPKALEQLHLVVNRFLQNAPEIDLGKWGQAVDLTCHRVGLLLSCDLEIAANMVSMEPVAVGGLQVKDKVKELVLFSVSEEFFAARQHLGLTIG